MRPHRDAHTLGWALGCDTPHCGASYVPVPAARTEEQLAADARRAGWRVEVDADRRQRGHRDWCPSCLPTRRVCPICRAVSTPPELATGIVWVGKRARYGDKPRRSERVLIYPPNVRLVDEHRIIATAAHARTRHALDVLDTHARAWATEQDRAHTLLPGDQDTAHPHLHYLPT